MEPAAEVEVADAPTETQDGFLWARAEGVLAPRSWRTLGALAFPETVVLNHVAVVGASGVASLDQVLLWCPSIRGAWLPIPEFVEATKNARLNGSCPIWAKNLSDAEINVDVRFRFSEGTERPSAPDSTDAYYASHVWKRTTWLGVPLLKYPTDLWSLQEILAEVRPDFVIETGTFHGGSALFLATTMDALGKNTVITIDVERQKNLPFHPRISYVTGSSVDRATLEVVKAWTTGERVLVVLDSDHSYEHVSAELRAYAPLVTPGSYLVVEDTNTPGPAEAVADFLASPEGAAFEADRSREKFGTGVNKGGWLRRREGGVR